MNINKVMAPIGMQTSTFFPITEEPAGAHPTYAAGVDMGAAVKGYLSVTTVTGELPGDDVIQLDSEQFSSGQADVETTMSSLEVNSVLYGHSYSEENGEVSARTDEPAVGAYTFVEPIMKKDKSRVYRATILFKVRAIPSAEKQEADTRKPSEFSPKNNAVSFKIMPDNSGAWRHRKDLGSLDAALSWIETVIKPVAKAASLPASG